ncbi:hypothetical protein BKA60DRAFT_663611 [Fusarium oxysporum]|nr:hypothetical protein BKA60DRAFT_663611 [Fusarium oxysporum]
MPGSILSPSKNTTLYMNRVHYNGTMQTGPQAGKRFVFVTADAHGQPAIGDRKLIRSHVMRGKNTRTRALPGRLKGRFPAIAVKSQRSQHAAGGNDSSEESHGARTRHELLNSDVDALVRMRHPGMVSRAANVFTFIKFPGDIDSSSRSLLCTCTTEFHSYMTIHELNKQLADPKTALTDSTTTVVMGMALIAVCFGDVESAHMHVMGLKQIVGLRGGIESFANKPQLQAKLHRICTGANPAFHQDAASFESAFDRSPELTLLKPADASYFSRSRSLVQALGRRFYGIFKDVQNLSQLINDSHNSGQKIREMSLEELMTSIQSRLFMLEFNDNDILPELLRLSLLAFLTTVFWSFPGVKLEYPHLANQLRQACLAFTPTTVGESYLFAWTLMVGATSVFHDNDQTWLPQRLHPLIRDSLGRTWFEVQNNLRRVMWIDSIHDGPGIEVFNQYLEETGDASITARSNSLYC